MILKKKYLHKNIERCIDINNIISRVKEAFNWMELNDKNLNLKNAIIKINNKSKNLKSDVELLKIKIIALMKYNDLYSSYLMKLVNSYLCDFLIRNIIKKYPNNFEPIKISLGIYYLKIIIITKIF